VSVCVYVCVCVCVRLTDPSRVRSWANSAGLAAIAPARLGSSRSAAARSRLYLLLMGLPDAIYGRTRGGPLARLIALALVFIACNYVYNCAGSRRPIEDRARQIEQLQGRHVELES
jgi:hypothetical protein